MVQLPVAHGQIILPDRVTSGRVTDVTSGHVTSCNVTSGSTSQHLRKYDFVRTHILLISFNHNAFRKGNSTTDHLFSLQSFGKKLCCGFIDFRKAFDTVWRTVLWKIVKNSGIKGKTFTVVYNMHDNIK